MTKLTKVIGIITKTTESYVPLNTPCIILIDENKLPHTAHCVNGGSGTYFTSIYNMKHTEYFVIKENSHE